MVDTSYFCQQRESQQSSRSNPGVPLNRFASHDEILLIEFNGAEYPSGSLEERLAVLVYIRRLIVVQQNRLHLQDDACLDVSGCASKNRRFTSRRKDDKNRPL